MVRKIECNFGLQGIIELQNMQNVTNIAESEKKYMIIVLLTII